MNHLWEIKINSLSTFNTIHELDTAFLTSQVTEDLITEHLPIFCPPPPTEVLFFLWLNIILEMFTKNNLAICF